ncbi:hypothetical protein GGF46_003923 [Coemansia sp. RSA 552]|nr:hypothetical protein GGF46_003923 [Coemansia sp. RSA 552]
MKLYIPVNLLMFLSFKRTKLIKAPKAAVINLFKSSARGALFFALMVNGVSNGSCLVRGATRRESLGGYVASGVLGGLAVLIEKPSRRIELAMYVFLRSLQVGRDIGVKKGIWRNIRHGETALFSASMGVLMAIFQNDPTTFNLTYHSVLTRMFGRN